MRLASGDRFPGWCSGSFLHFSKHPGVGGWWGWGLVQLSGTQLWPDVTQLLPQARRGGPPQGRGTFARVSILYPRQGRGRRGF